MLEAEGEEPRTIRSEPHGEETTPIEREFMDLDLDLDPSWPFDPNPFGVSPSSPFLLSCSSSPFQNPSHLQPPFSASSDQPSSPLWIFPDAAADEKPADYTVNAFSGGFRLTAAATADCPKHLPRECSSTLFHQIRSVLIISLTYSMKLLLFYC